MPSITSIISELKNRFPGIAFKSAGYFCWSANDKILYYDPSVDNEFERCLLFHETGHAILKHQHHDTDVQLIKMERDAWEEAKKLAQDFELDIPDDVIEECLDSYRQWLHSRSKCPNCNLTGLQTKHLNYSCAVCNYSWTVNEAKIKALRRYNKKRT